MASALLRWIITGGFAPAHCREADDEMRLYPPLVVLCWWEACQMWLYWEKTSAVIKGNKLTALTTLWLTNNISFFFWHGILAKIMNCEFFSEGDGFGKDVCSLWGNCQCSSACPTYARKGRRCFFFPGGLFHMRFVSDSLRIISAANGSLCKWMQIGDKLIWYIQHFFSQTGKIIPHSTRCINSSLSANLSSVVLLMVKLF